MKKNKELESEFIILMEKKADYEVSLKQAGEALQLKYIREIWNIDLKIDSLVNRIGISNLTEDMRGYEPFGSFQMMHFYRLTVKKLREDNRKSSGERPFRLRRNIVNDEEIRNIVMGHISITFGIPDKIYTTWDEAISAIFHMNENMKEMKYSDHSGKFSKDSGNKNVREARSLKSNHYLQTTKWREVSIVILDEFTIHINNKTQKFDIRFTQTKYFINKTTNNPNNSWELLLELSSYGSFNPKEYSYQTLTKKPGRAKHRVYTLGRKLMDEFGINEKPFLPYDKDAGWFPKFTIKDERPIAHPGERHVAQYKAQQKMKRKGNTPKEYPKIGDSFSSEELEPYDDNQNKHVDKLDHPDDGFNEITENEL